MAGTRLLVQTLYVLGALALIPLALRRTLVARAPLPLGEIECLHAAMPLRPGELGITLRLAMGRDSDGKSRSDAAEWAQLVRSEFAAALKSSLPDEAPLLSVELSDGASSTEEEPSSERGARDDMRCPSIAVTLECREHPGRATRDDESGGSGSQALSVAVDGKCGARGLVHCHGVREARGGYARSIAASAGHDQQVPELLHVRAVARAVASAVIAPRSSTADRGGGVVRLALKPAYELMLTLLREGPVRPRDGAIACGRVGAAIAWNLRPTLAKLRLVADFSVRSQTETLGMAFSGEATEPSSAQAESPLRRFSTLECVHDRDDRGGARELARDDGTTKACEWRRLMTLRQVDRFLDLMENELGGTLATAPPPPSAAASGGAVRTLHMILLATDATVAPLFIHTGTGDELESHSQSHNRRHQHRHPRTNLSTSCLVPNWAASIAILNHAARAPVGANEMATRSAVVADRVGDGAVCDESTLDPAFALSVATLRSALGLTATATGGVQMEYSLAEDEAWSTDSLKSARSIPISISFAVPDDGSALADWEADVLTRTAINAHAYRALDDVQISLDLLRSIPSMPVRSCTNELGRYGVASRDAVYALVELVKRNRNFEHHLLVCHSDPRIAGPGISSEHCQKGCR